MNNSCSTEAMTGHTVRSFTLGDDHFDHVIYAQDDDRVEVMKNSEGTEWVFNASCGILKNGVLVGNFRQIENQLVATLVLNGLPHTIHTEVNPNRIEAYLDAEVVVVKYLVEQGLF